MLAERQSAALQQIANDVSSLRTMMIFFVVVTVISIAAGFVVGFSGALT